MPKVALITLHGMGETPSTYADPLKAKLQQALGAPYAKLTIEPVYYQDLLQKNQDADAPRSRSTRGAAATAT